MNGARYFFQPLRIDPRGRAAEATRDEHVRQLMEAVLFTAPGERVQLPEFGCGLRQLLFAPNRELLATATEALVAASLERWLADWILVERVEVRVEDAALFVRVEYVRRDTREPHQVEFLRT